MTCLTRLDRAKEFLTVLVWESERLDRHGNTIMNPQTGKVQYMSIWGLRYYTNFVCADLVSAKVHNMHSTVVVLTEFEAADLSISGPQYRRAQSRQEGCMASGWIINHPEGLFRLTCASIMNI